jgi:hypothetical protein
MAAVRPPDFIFVADFLAGEEVGDTRHEYLGGAGHAMPGATIRHNNIAGNCFASLNASLRGRSCQPFNRDTKAFPGSLHQASSSPEGAGYGVRFCWKAAGGDFPDVAALSARPGSGD